jgi:hypothetical protein
MVGMRKIEVWQLKPVPRKVAAVGEELFEEYLRKKQELCPYDLGTDWFGRLMAMLFRNDGRSAAVSFGVVDVTGASRTIYAKNSVSISMFNSTYYYDSGCYIGIGTGTTPPTKQDYKLASEVARAAAGATYADGGTSFSVSATFSLSSDTQITEVGLFWRDGFNGYIFLLDRTLLDPPVTFPANTPMVVNYVFAI